MSATPGTIEIVWSAYRSVIGNRRLAYLSAPITSGRRAMESMGEDSKSQVIRENIAAGTTLAREISGRHGWPVVAPTVFNGRAQKWDQADYMQMWLRMIEENVGDVFMSPEWAFSNGCTEEYLKVINLAHGFGSRSDVFPRRPDGRVIPLHEGMEEVSEALHLMQERKIKSETLASVLIGLYSVHVVWTTPDTMQDLSASFNAEVVYGVDGHRVLATMRGAAPLLRHYYGWDGQVNVTFADGAVRKIQAWPEGVVLDLIEDGKEGGG